MGTGGVNHFSHLTKRVTWEKRPANNVNKTSRPTTPVHFIPFTTGWRWACETIQGNHHSYGGRCSCKQENLQWSNQWPTTLTDHVPFYPHQPCHKMVRQFNLIIQVVEPYFKFFSFFWIKDRELLITRRLHLFLGFPNFRLYILITPSPHP